MIIQPNTSHHIIEDLKEWPITRFYNRRGEFIQALNDFAFKRLGNREKDLQSVLEKTLYLEAIRAKKEPWKVDPVDDKTYWKKLGQQLAKSVANESDTTKKEVNKFIKRIINRYSEEIVGGFQPKTYRFFRKLLTSVYKRLFLSIKAPYLIKAWGNYEDLMKKMHISGSVDQIRKLFPKHTVILVPTHFSNLDSILLGYFIDSKLGIPAFSWGAGLNLYDYELFAHYMNKLGTYRVDRRKKNPIYLETLKSMTTLSIHFGLNNIFFPGGTRSRSGALESKLKLGLLQSTIEAQRLNIIEDKSEKIIIVPVILGYHFVLEAAGLIEQQLQYEGKEKYTSIKYKESKLSKISVITSNMMTRGTDVRVHFCQPMDVLGNKVDEDGNSFDKNGMPINLADYFTLGNEIQNNYQRERVYTEILSKSIVKSFYSENIILSSHLIAFTAFNLYKKLYSDISIYDLVNKSRDKKTISHEDMMVSMKSIISHVRETNVCALSEEVEKGAEHALNLGLKKLGLFHRRKPLYRTKSNEYTSESLKLLYYYHNRLSNFGLEIIFANS